MYKKVRELLVEFRKKLELLDIDDLLRVKVEILPREMEKMKLPLVDKNIMLSIVDLAIEEKMQKNNINSNKIKS